MNIYGRIVTGRDVRVAAAETLQTWVPSLLGEVAVQADRARCDLPAPISYSTGAEFDKWPEDQIPACVVITPGLAKPPKRDADGSHSATWSLGVGMVVSGPDRDSTADLVELYTAAGRTALLQHPSLGGLALGVEWIDEDYDELEYDDRRTIGAGISVFEVQVDDVVDAFGGPKVAPEDPCTDPGDYGLVQATPLTTNQG